ncbi:MAG: DUF5652 family protein [Patescibacteria group bacterium]|nr:DUF5652 family protein [Patescibacteria group bacterium]
MDFTQLQALQQNVAVMVVVSVWTLPWKGWALWKAARKGSKPWFIALLLINTLAILDILYIYVFSKRGEREPVPSEVEEDKKSI